MSAQQRPALQGSDGSTQLVLDAGGFSGEVNGLRFSPDGREIIVGGEKLVRCWDIASGDLRWTLRGQRGTASLGNVGDLCVTNDTLTVGIQGLGETFRDYDYQTLPPTFLRTQGMKNVAINRVVRSADGRHIAFHGVDLKGDQPKRSIFSFDTQANRMTIRLDCEFITYLGFPTSDSHLYGFTDRGAFAFDAVTGQTVENGGHLPAIQAANRLIVDSLPYEAKPAFFEPMIEQQMIVVSAIGESNGAPKYIVATCNMSDGKPVGVYEKHRYLPSRPAVSPDGKLIAAGDTLGEIHVWEAATGNPVRVFKSGTRPIWDVGFDETGTKIGFGIRPNQGKEWRTNHWSELDQVFDLVKRRIVPASGETFRQELINDGQRWIKSTKDKTIETLNFQLEMQDQTSSPIAKGKVYDSYIWTYSLLRSLGQAQPGSFAFADRNIVFLGFPTQGVLVNHAMMMGHEESVTAMSESSDGRFLATSGMDGTIRIWNLERFGQSGTVDLDISFENGLIHQVAAGGASEKAGVKPGDYLLKIGDVDVSEIGQLSADNRFPYMPGDKVTLTLRRGEENYQADVELIRDPMLRARLLLSLFISRDNEWVLWTPEGYYDASPRGDSLIGWHVNRGWDQAADYYPARLFQENFYRPDVIDQVLVLGNTSEAIAAANAQQARPPKPMDLRDKQQMNEVQPPSIQIVSPQTGSLVQDETVIVEVQCASTGMPIREVRVLVNGIAVGKPILPSAESLQAPLKQTVTLTPGRNVLTAVALTPAARSVSNEVIVELEQNVPEPTILKSKLFVLSVGVSQFQHEEYNLNFADNDATEFAKLFAERQSGLYRDVQSKLLVNQDATRQGILDAMDWLVENCQPTDVAVMFVSSHGVRDARDNYYFAPHDLDVERMRSTGLRWSEVQALIEDLPCKFLLFADTCHSGGVSGGQGSIRDPLRSLAQEEVGAVVFCSSLPREESLERPDWGHGAFTKAILDAAADRDSDLDKPGDGLLTLSEIQFNLSRRVKKLTNDAQHPVILQPPTVSDFNVLSISTP
ncbi:caspase family protein [Stieleria varia]|uniref:caspase family protein n=1 Tax=Stieleria varia TaxID=2528005 RepID=UPI001E3285CC|nr:caspase family protein [Stieleria varia]